VNAAEVERLLGQWGLGWQRGAAAQLWWIGAIGERGDYQIRLHVDEHRMLLAYRFSKLRLREDVDTFMLLLNSNDRLTVFKLAVDDDGRALLLATWPATWLTADNLGFLITDMVEQIDRLQDDIAARLESPG
jgi:hypothetical protein